MMSQLLSPYSPGLGYSHPPLAIPGLPSDTYAILAVAIARIYHAQLNNKVPEWCYSRMKGTLVFGKDVGPISHLAAGQVATIDLGSHWFRLLDAKSGKPIWMFKVPVGFAYELDKPFFHAFQGKSRRFGFLFDDDDEASTLARKVIAQTYSPRPPKSRSLSLTMMRRKPSSAIIRSQVLPSMVSLPTPNSFVHVGHVGMNGDGVIEATKGIEASWKAFLEGHNQNGYDGDNPDTPELEKSLLGDAQRHQKA